MTENNIRKILEYTEKKIKQDLLEAKGNVEKILNETPLKGKIEDRMGRLISSSDKYGLILDEAKEMGYNFPEINENYENLSERIKRDIDNRYDFLNQEGLN